nr:diguanylate cyclase [Bacillus sp. T3]
MNNPIAINQRHKSIVKVIWVVFIMLFIPLNVYWKDVSIVKEISIVVLPLLLFLTYLSVKKRRNNLSIYLLAIMSFYVLSLLNHQSSGYAYLFILSLPPLLNSKGLEVEANLQNQFRLLNGVSEAINTLFTKTNQKEAINEALALIGYATKVDCIHLFENTFSESRNEYLLVERYRWGKEANLADSRNNEMQYINTGRSHWVGILSSGVTIQGPASAFPEPERYTFELNGIRSILVLPIFIDDYFWGFICLEDCENERYWNLDEENTLLTAASALGVAVKRLDWKKQEEKLKQRSVRLEALISHMDSGIVAEDKQNRLFLINEQFYQIMGVPPLHERGQGISREQFFDEVKNFFKQGELIAKRNKEIFLSRKKVIGEEWVLKDERIISRDAIPIFTNGEFDGYLWQFRETTEQKRHEQKLKEASIIDGLTKIYNRRYFDEKLEKEWGRCKRGAKPLTLILFDIDGFKIFNDTYGHQKGDKCLIQVAQTAKEILRRPSDVVCRYGGRICCNST